MSSSFATPWIVACQVLSPWDFPGKNIGVSILQKSLPSEGDLPDPGNIPIFFLHWQAEFITAELPRKLT